MFGSQFDNKVTRLWWLLMLLAVVGMPVAAAADEITIEVAPRTLNLDSDGQVVTVHTEIDYWEVDVSSVFLEGVLISSWKADNRGNFVAKFLMDEIKAIDGLHIDDYNTLTLVGATVDGVAFVGTQEVMVIDVSGPPGGPEARAR